MKAHEIFQEIDAPFAGDIIGYFRDESREIYKTTLASLAIQKKLRPVFIQKKPVKDQIAWLIKTLKLRLADGVGEHLLQVWLLQTQQPMLIQFLDAMEIEHDDEGAVEDLPESIDAEKLGSAIDGLLEKYPAPLITLYLRVFQMQQANGWPEIAGMLENDERLTLKGPVEIEEPAPPESGAE